MNAMLADRLALAQRKQYGSSSEKYAEGYEQMDLFNEAEATAEINDTEEDDEIVIAAHKRKKRAGPGISWAERYHYGNRMFYPLS